MKKVFGILALAIFLFYWFITLIFTFPDSSIVIAENMKNYKRFNELFYQRWTFFAPPPKSNKRLTYVFLSEDEKGRIQKTEIEIFQHLADKIRSHYPFNDIYLNLDWTLFQQTEQIMDFMRKNYEMMEMANLLNPEKKLNPDELFDKISPEIHKLPPFVFLFNHATALKKELGLPADVHLQIIISELEIPKYADRYKQTTLKENIIYFTNLYNYKTGQWEE